MEAIDDKEKVKKLYKQLLQSPDPEIAADYKAITEQKFVSRFLEDSDKGSDARSLTYEDVMQTQSESEDYHDWVKKYAPKFSKYVDDEVVAPEKKKDVGGQSLQPLPEDSLQGLEPRQGSIPLVPTEEMRPKEFTPNFNQFQNEKALQQSAQSPAFKDYSIAKGVLEDREKLYADSPLIENKNEFGRWDVQQFSADGNEVINTLGTYDTQEQAQKAIRANRRQAAPSGLIFPFKDDEKGYNQAESEKRIAENEKIRQGAKLKTVGMAEAIYERGKKHVKDLGLGAFYALSARTRMSPLYPGADEMIKKKIFQESEKIDAEFSKALTDSGIETSVLDAVRKGEYEKIPEATLYTIGDVAMQIIPAWFTYGSSTYLQTIANAYKNGVNEVAKAKGITPEQVIDSGDDKEILANASTLIVSGLDLLGAKLVPKAIAGKGAYAAIRDGILKVIGGKGGLKQTAAVAGGVAGSSLLETGTELGQEVTAIVQEALAGGGDIKGAMKLLTERYESGEIPERLYQTAVNALVGTGGLVVGGRAIKKAIGGETQESAQVQQEPAQPAPNAFEGAQTPQQAAAAPVATPTTSDPAEAALNNALETGDTSQLTPEQLEVYEQMGGVMPQADVVKRQIAAKIDAFVNLASSPETDLYELYDDAANSDLPDADKQTLLNLIDDELILRERNESKAEETVATTPEGAAITSVGNIVIQPEIKARTVDVTADRYEGVTGDINGQQGTFTATEDGHVDFVTEQGETIQLDGGRIGFVETVKDENGTVVGVVLADAVSGLKINVNDSEIALDLATLAMQDQLAKVEISDGEFNAAIQQVSTTLAANEATATDQTVVSQTADTGSQPQQSANVVEVDAPAMQTEQEVEQVAGGEVGQEAGQIKIDKSTKVYHASAKPRKGRLIPNTAPQFGYGVYFTTKKEDAESEFGSENTTEATLDLKNPVYTNTPEWAAVEKLAVENANKAWSEKNKSKFTEDEKEIYEQNGFIDHYDYYDIPSDFISDAAKELGHDAIIDTGKGNYENEIAVLDEKKIIYPEDNDTDIQPNQSSQLVQEVGQPATPSIPPSAVEKGATPVVEKKPAPAKTEAPAETRIEGETTKPAAEKQVRRPAPPKPEGENIVGMISNKISSLANKFRGNNATKISLNIKGPNGAVLTSYEWANQEVAPKQVYKGKVVAKAVRVSDWKEAAANAETGRSIVHKFTVELPDGTQRTVSAESLPSALGYTSKEFEDVFPNAKNILQSIAKLRMREQSLIDYLDSVKPIEKEAESNARQEQEKQAKAEKKRIADEWNKKKDELEQLIKKSEPRLAEILQKKLDKGPEVFYELGFGQILFDELYGKNLNELGVFRHDIREAQMDLNKTRDKIENKYKQLAEVVPNFAPTETPAPEKQPRRPAPPKPEAGQESTTLAQALQIDEDEAIQLLSMFGGNAKKGYDKAFQALLKTPESELADYLSDDQMKLLPKLQEYSKQFGGKRKTAVEKMADIEAQLPKQANNLFEATRLATEWAYLNIAYYGPKAAKTAKRKLHETLKSAGVASKKAADIAVKAFQNAAEALRKATINWLDGQIADINEMNKGGNAYSGTDFGTNKLWLAGFKALRNAMLSKNANLEAELDKFDATLKKAGVTAKTIEEYKTAYREAIIDVDPATKKEAPQNEELTRKAQKATKPLRDKILADVKVAVAAAKDATGKAVARTQAFTDYLKQLEGIKAITPQQVKKIFRQYASAIISDKGLQKAIAFAEKVADDAEFETAVSAAKSAYNSIKKGSPRYSPVDNSFAASLPAIDFASLEKEELQALAEQMKAWKKAKVSGTAASTNALKAALEAAAQKAPIEPMVVTVDKTEGDPQADKDEKAPIIEAIKTTLADLEPAATPMTQQALDGLKKQDLTWLSKTQLIQLANSIAAYQETGVLAGASDLLQQAKAKQNTSGLGQTWATIVGLMRRMPFYGKNRNVEGTAAKQTMASFTTLFQTIKADAAKIRAAIMPWEQKIGRVLSAHKLFQLEVFEKVNKLALTDEDKYIAGAYGFLAENSGNSQPFEVKLKAVAAELSKAGVLLHKKIGTLKRKGSNQDLRNQKRVNNDAKALEALGLVDLDYIGKDVVSVRPRQDASLEKMQEAFNANQKAKQFYDYSQQKFAEGSAAYFESLALNFGKLAEPIEGYQHRMFIPLEMKDVSEALPDDFGMGFGFGGAASDVTGTNKGRTELGTQGIYDFNLENLLLNGIWDMKLTSELGSEYAYEKAILNSPQGLASFVKSKPEYNKFREYLVSRITGNIDAGYFMDDETSLAKGVGQSVSRNVAKTVVGNISQLAKQTPSLFYLATYNPKAFVKAEKIIVEYTAETTKMQLGLAYNEELVEAFNTFLQSTTYPFRTNLGYIELAQELTKENKYSRALTVTTDAIDKYTGGKVVQSMDKLITATALLTGYIEKTGSSDLVAENKKGFNAEGLAAGENVAEQSNSVSDPSALSTEFKERDSIDRFLRSMVAVTTNAFWQNVKVVGDSAMPIESRNMAARHALSYLGMTASFAIVSKMAGEAMVAGSFALVNAVSDMIGSDLYLSKDGEDEKEKEFKNELSIARKVMEAFMTVLFGTYGNYADAIIRAGIEGSFALIRAYRYNEAKKEDTREGTKKEVLSMPQGQSDFAPILFPEMPMGAYGVPYDMVMSIAQSALRKNMETELPWILGQMAALRLGLGTPYSIASYGKRGMSAPAKGSDLQEFKKENSREYVRWVQSMRKEGLKDKDLGKFVFKGVLDQRIILTPAQAKQYMESYNNNLKKLEPVYETLVSFYEKSGEEAPKRKSQLEIEEQANTFAQIPFLAQ